MTITVKHSKTNAIADWTQAQLDEQIDLGNFAPGTTLADIVLPSDWNNDHTFTGTLDVTNGGTGATTLTGYVKGSGTSALTASSTIPNTDISGLGTISTQNANNVSITGGSINGTTIGATTASTGKFTDLTDTGLTSGRVTYATTGGNLTDSANLTFNGTTLTTTGVVTPSVTASSTDLTLSSISTGNINLNTAGGTSLKASQTFLTGTAVNYFDASGRQTGLGPIFSVNGSDADVRMNITAKGTGSIGFYTNLANTLQMQITPTASAVNYVQVTGAATGGSGIISSQGSDSNIGLQLRSKGTGDINLMTAGGTNQAVVRNIASAVNYTSLRGSATGLAIPYTVEGTDTNISMAFQPKGTGAIDLAAGSSGVNISNGGTVTAITRTATGSNYTSFPTITISPPTTAGGVTAIATISKMGAGSVSSIQSGGTGYTVNDILTVVGGTPTVGGATYTVTSVSGGVVTGVTPLNFAEYTVLPTSPVSTTGGTGTGCTLNLTYFVSGGGWTISNAGSGYIEQPTVTFSGGGGSGAAAYATVGSSVRLQSLGTTSEVAFAFRGASGINSPTAPDILRILDVAAANDAGIFIQNSGFGRAQIQAYGNANANLFLCANGSGRVTFTTSGTSLVEQMRVSHTASAVNYVQVTGSATATQPVISAQGSDASVGLRLQWKGQANMFFTSGAGAFTQFRILGANSAVNNLAVTGTAAGSAPILSAEGSDTNIDLSLTPKGTGNIVGNVNSGTFTLGRDSSNNAIKFTAPNGNLYLQSTGGGVILFNTGDGTPNQMRVAHTASAVNYVQVTGSATGGNPAITVQGSDATRGLAFSAKGNANINFFNNNLSNNIFVISGNAGTIANYLQATASVAGTATSLQAQGSDTNIDLALTPKGTGVVQFGTHTANADTAISGYITIRDAGGTLRKLAVIT